VPLRAANARILIEQSIGRGLRLPYGQRTGVTPVDRLNIVAHDRFQEIIDEANRPDSAIHLQQVILDSDQLQEKTVTVVSLPVLDIKLGLAGEKVAPDLPGAAPQESAIFQTVEEKKVVEITRKVIRELENQPQKVPSTLYLQQPAILSFLKERVEKEYQPTQLELEGIVPQPDIKTIVEKTTEIFVKQTINIPRISVIPKTERRTGFKPFKLELNTLNYPAPSEELWIQHLRTKELEVLSLEKGGFKEVRLEDFIVSGLVDFDDVAYDDHADLLYDLAGQTVKHFLGYLSEEDTRKVLRLHQRDIARFIHAQMQDHYWEDETDYEVIISHGWTELKSSAYTVSEKDPPIHFHQSPEDRSNMSKYLFGGFTRCLYPLQKFHSDSERRMAVILDRDTLKWFRPAKGQFQIFYRWQGDHPEYQPDFVAEEDETIYMIETKLRREMDDPEVQAKKGVAVRWCGNASDYSQSHSGKPWQYLLIPHDAVLDNMTLSWLAQQYSVEITFDS
jgi:type III restriction enzyme